MHSLSIAYLALDTLKPRPTNPGMHTKKQIRQLARSIEVFGFTNPILIDRQRGIVAGHGRVAAANLLGLSQVPTICLDDMTESQIRAYVLADKSLCYGLVLFPGTNSAFLLADALFILPDTINSGPVRIVKHHSW